MCGRHVRKTERRSARFCSIPSPKKAAYLQATSHMIIIGRGLWKPQGPHRLLTVRCPSDRSTVAPRGRASSKARRSCAGAWRWHSELVARSRAAGAPRRRARRANRRRRALCRGRPGDQHYPRVRERLESVPGVVRALPARQHASAGRRYRPICHLARQTRSGRLHDPPPRCCDRPRPPPGRPPTRHQRPSRPHRARGDRPRPRLSPEQETALLRDPLLELIDRIDTAPQPGYATARCCCSDSRSACGDPSSSRSQSRTSPPSPDGLRIRIARSKTDQHGRGQELLVRDQNLGGTA